MADIATDGKGNYVTLEDGKWVPTAAPDTEQPQGGHRFTDAPPEKPPLPTQPTLTDSSTWALPQEPAAQRIRQAATDAFENAPSLGTRPGNMSVLTPEGQQAVNTAFGWSGRNVINPLATGLGYVAGGLAAGAAAAGATVGELTTAVGQPSLGRDINIAAQTVPATMDIPAFSARGNIPRLERPGPRYVAPDAVTPDALRMADARQAVRNALMPSAEEIAPRPSSPTGISGPMPPPEGYVPPAPKPAPGEAPFTGVPKTSDEAKQVAGQYYRINAAQGGRSMPADFTNLTSDDVNAALSKGPMEQAFTTDHPLTSIAKDLNDLRDSPTTLEDAQRAYSRLGDLATREFRANGNSETYRDMIGIQSNMRDRIAPPDLAGDDPWTKARKAWSQSMKMDDLERMKARADGTKNPQTSFQTQVNNMLNNDARIRGWSDEEKAALRNAGTNGAIGGVLHLLGSRLIPIAAAATEFDNPAAAIMHGTVAYTLGSGMRAAENWMQTRRYNQALRVLGRGVPRNQMMP